ncbi:unnamed protein product [Phyllotreta striolata]|uniref:Uncharacterized protein n=1 Tax=Phyllotreta striolata TaxID=444603 RepID=A0A9N9TZ87_PHYSR|nr:unnamed protein product [Phyllotreta striolata]
MFEDEKKFSVSSQPDPILRIERPGMHCRNKVPTMKRIREWEAERKKNIDKTQSTTIEEAGKERKMPWFFYMFKKCSMQSSN